MRPYQYDLDGNLTESVDANANAPTSYALTGHVIKYSYDSLKQETGEQWYTNTTDAAAGTNSTASAGTARTTADGIRRALRPATTLCSACR